MTNLEEKSPESIFEMRQVVQSSSGQKSELIYREADPLQNLEGREINEVRACCFVDDKLVIVYEPRRDIWNLPGGKTEQKESFKDATVREIKEETNMEVVSQAIIGYVDTKEARYTYSWCSVKPLGKFVVDPDEDISGIKLIEPKNIKEYYDWGPISQRVVARAVELNRSLKESVQK